MVVGDGMEFFAINKNFSLQMIFNKMYIKPDSRISCYLKIFVLQKLSNIQKSGEDIILMLILIL